MALLTSACSESGTPAEILEPAAASVFKAADDQLEQVAVWLANALDEPEARSLVYRAMEASPWNEHKVILQDLLQDNGLGLGRAIMNANQITREELADRPSGVERDPII